MWGWAVTELGLKKKFFLGSSFIDSSYKITVVAELAQGEDLDEQTRVSFLQSS